MTTQTSTPIVTDGEALEEYQDAVIKGKEAAKQGDNSRWLIGDLANALPKVYGWGTIGQFGDDIGIAQAVNYATVSATYEKSVRTEYSDLSWSHFERLASRKKRTQWLKKAQDNKWSVRQLKTALDESDEKADRALSPLAAQV